MACSSGPGADRASTQNEFFHTFNVLHENHKQIVLTADRKPHEISDIADRLRTRFAWDLLADIKPPELVRIAILRKKAAVESVALPDDVAMYIASAIKSNVRELEGALIRLAAYARCPSAASTSSSPRRPFLAPPVAERSMATGAGTRLVSIMEAVLSHTVARCSSRRRLHRSRPGEAALIRRRRADPGAD